MKFTLEASSWQEIRSAIRDIAKDNSVFYNMAATPVPNPAVDALVAEQARSARKKPTKPAKRKR